MIFSPARFISWSVWVVTFPGFAVDGHDSSTALVFSTRRLRSFFFVDQAEHVGLQFVKGFGS